MNVEDPDRAATADITEFGSSRIVDDVRTKTPAFLVLSDVYYPGWKVNVDGKTARLFETNYALRGVRVPEGKHVVAFEYRPRAFYMGLATSVIALVIALVPWVRHSSIGGFGTRRPTTSTSMG